MLCVSGEVTPPYVFVMENDVIFLAMNFRMCRLDSLGVDLHCGVIGNKGRTPHIRMSVHLYDMCSTNSLRSTSELQCIEHIDSVPTCGVMCCYENYGSDNVQSICVIDEQWTRQMFYKHSTPSITRKETADETLRIAALSFRFERITHTDYK